MDDLIVRSVTGPDAGRAQWALAYLPVAADEGRKFLNDDQYAHAVGLIEALAFEQDPTHPKTVDVRPFKGMDFFEVRDKGGVLGKINLRIFFTVDHDRKRIVVLGAIK